MSKDYPPYLDYPKHRSMNDKDKAFWVREPDLVEVVRCKDCKFYDPAHIDRGGCELERDVHGTSGVWYINDFCSYGERKDNG